MFLKVLVYLSMFVKNSNSTNENYNYIDSNLRKIQCECKNYKSNRIINRDKNYVISYEKDYQTLQRKYKYKNRYIKKISWKDYLTIDNYDFYNDLNEMYMKYLPTSQSQVFESVIDLEELNVNKDLAANLDIYDINELFNNNLDKYYNFDGINNHNQCYVEILSLMNQSIKKFHAEKFLHIVEIIENDVINILENSIKYLYPENNFLKSLLSKIKTNIDLDNKIANLLYISKEILDFNFEKLSQPNDDRFIFLNLILFNSYIKGIPANRITKKLYNKFKSLNVKLCRGEITELEILLYNIKFINNINDKKDKEVCIFGLQNLFRKDLKLYKPRFFYLLIYLFAYFNERHFFQLDWHNNLIKLLSFTLHYYKNLKNFTSLVKFLGSKDCFYKYRLYIALNTENILEALISYNQMKVHRGQSQIINNLIDITNKVKCKLLNIS